MKTPQYFAITALFFVAVIFVVAEDGKKEFPSPDGRFVMKFTDADGDVPFGIFEKASGKLLMKAPEDTINSFTQSIICVWSADSSQFALNCRMGARYDTALVFRWDGKAFQQLPDVEEMLSKKLEAEKEADRKKQGIKKDAYQRRIWDSCKVRRWIDARTLEVDASSLRSVMLAEDDFAEISGSLRFQLQLDKAGKWKIARQRRLTAEEQERE